MDNVTLLGLGIMGSAMARNILKAGFPLTVYNRTRAKAEELAAQGARVAVSPRQAAQGADVVISMVGDDAASQAIWLGEEGALAGAPPQAVLVECSTLSPAWVRELAQRAAARGLALLDAPVLGSKDAAEAADLKILVGGDAAALERARPVLEAISREIHHMGPGGSGAVMKLVNNLIVAVQATGLAEGLTLAERAGLNMEQVASLITSSSPGSPFVKAVVPRMLARDRSQTHFALRWMRKDLTYALRLADDLGVPMPTVAIAREMYRMAGNLGLDTADLARVVDVLRQS